MQPRIEILPFQPRQLARILEIERASFGKDAYPEDLFRELYQDCGSLFLVAKRSGRIVGYMVSCRDEREAELVSIAVHPDCRSGGVGAALIKFTVSRLKRARVRRFALMVKTSNKRAIAFYERHGWVKARRVRRYYEDRSDGWLMFYAAFEEADG